MNDLLSGFVTDSMASTSSLPISIRLDVLAEDYAALVGMRVDYATATLAQVLSEAMLYV